MKDELQKLYAEGRNSEILEIISEMPSEAVDDEIMIIEAWANYRLKNYEESKRIAQFVGNERAAEVLASIAAYVDKDDDYLFALQEKYPDNESIFNAFAIRARDDDSDISGKTLISGVERFLTKKTIGSANLCNNVARFFLKKATSSKSIFVAMALWDIALGKYGKKNYHHKAAVYFWISKAYEELGILELAQEAAKSSLNLWEMQASLDPENKSFAENLNNAYQRVYALEEKLDPRGTTYS